MLFTIIVGVLVALCLWYVVLPVVLIVLGFGAAGLIEAIESVSLIEFDGEALGRLVFRFFLVVFGTLLVALLSAALLAALTGHH